MLVLRSYRKSYLTKLRRKNAGQTAIEYVMLIVLVSVSIFIASPNMTNSVLRVFAGTSKMLEDGMSPQRNPTGVPERSPTDNS